ncbi:MAG: zinc metallopeptidase [Firmicutes bacterium]|nr:zinc metallopeptidase [Bacillota bacterium]
MFYDSTFLVVIPAFLFALYAQYKVQSTFGHYLRVRARSGYTGAEVARNLLAANGAGDVRVGQTNVTLGDHFDPRNKSLMLSPQVYQGTSLAAISVAAHETGHALQNQEAYVPMQIRQAFVPVASFGSSLAIPLFFIGMLMGASNGQFLMTLGIWLFTAAVAFQVITLPVEFNASARALRLLSEGGYVTAEEVPHARQVLEAAALTYVAAAAVAVTQLLRLILLRGSRRD